MVQRYAYVIRRLKEYGYLTDGYPAEYVSIPGLTYLGNVKALEKVLERRTSDKVVVALPPEEFCFTQGVIKGYEKDGIKLSTIPF